MLHISCNRNCISWADEIRLLNQQCWAHHQHTLWITHKYTGTVPLFRWILLLPLPIVCVNLSGGHQFFFLFGLVMLPLSLIYPEFLHWRHYLIFYILAFFSPCSKRKCVNHNSWCTCKLHKGRKPLLWDIMWFSYRHIHFPSCFLSQCTLCYKCPSEAVLPEESATELEHPNLHQLFVSILATEGGEKNKGSPCLRCQWGIQVSPTGHHTCQESRMQ